MTKLKDGGVALFCDDVRDEISGQSTIVGLYGDMLRVDRLPVRLKQICALVIYHCALPIETNDELHLLFTFPNDHEPIRHSVSLSKIVDEQKGLKPVASAEGLRLDMRFIFNTVAIQKPEPISVNLRRGDADQVIGLLEIVSGDDDPADG